MKITNGNYRNQLCGCKSGKKYKRCCLFKFQGYVSVDNLWIKLTGDPQPQEAKIV